MSRVQFMHVWTDLGLYGGMHSDKSGDFLRILISARDFRARLQKEQSVTYVQS